MTIEDALHEGHHELCRNHAKSSSQGQCPGSETIQWMWQSVYFKALTDVTIWSLLHKMSRDILARSPVASDETSKRRTSSKSTSIQIEKPRRGHNLGCPETLFQARNSRVNDWVRNKRTKWHKQARHTLTGSSITLSLPGWSVKVNDGWNCRNSINKYLQHIV